MGLPGSELSSAAAQVVACSQLAASESGEGLQPKPSDSRMEDPPPGSKRNRRPSSRLVEALGLDQHDAVTFTPEVTPALATRSSVRVAAALTETGVLSKRSSYGTDTHVLSKRFSHDEHSAPPSKRRALAEHFESGLAASDDTPETGNATLKKRPSKTSGGTNNPEKTETPTVVAPVMHPPVAQTIHANAQHNHPLHAHVKRAMSEEVEDDAEFPASLQQVIGQMLDVLVAEEDQIRSEKIPQVAKTRAKKLRAAGTHQAIQPLYIGFEEARLRLSVGHFEGIQELYRELEGHCVACWVSLQEANAGNPVLDASLCQYFASMAQQYAQEVSTMVEEIAEKDMGKAGRRAIRITAAYPQTGTPASPYPQSTSKVTSAEPQTKTRQRTSSGGGACQQKHKHKPKRRVLFHDEGMPKLHDTEAEFPESIVANTAPYKQGAWRRQPFPARPYINVSEYLVLGAFPQDKQLTHVRLQTQRPDGANANFKTEHEADLGHKLREVELQLADAVQRRAAMVLGADVEEIDAWGMDMYTRKNIADALLESRLFSETTPPAPSKSAADKPPRGEAGSDQLGSSKAAEHGGDNEQPLSDKATRPDEAMKAAIETTVDVADRKTPDRKGAEEVERTEHKQTDGDEPQSKDQEPNKSEDHTSESEEPLTEIDIIDTWIDQTFLPAVNHTGSQAFNMLDVCETLRKEGSAAGDTRTVAAADVIEARVKCSGWPYFRVHPKSRGIQCTRKGGVPAFTFVEEYLGEVHNPWRWSELQDVMKRQKEEGKSKKEEDTQPDFYNIALDRPADDPAGIDVLYVDSASVGSFVSRMAHSCTPNCQAVVVSTHGRLTIAVYTTRDVGEGEELTLDYSSVTESEKEFRSAICLCGTQSCRGSYLHFAGAKAYSLAIETHHTLLHRQAILLRACSEPMSDKDYDILKKHGFGKAALEHGLPADVPPVPSWVPKWVALILQFVEYERSVLPGMLQALQGPGEAQLYTEEYADAQAQAVMTNRINSILLTLDKIKMFLRHPGQQQAPPVKIMTEGYVLTYLWTGEKSFIRRLILAAAPVLGGATLGGMWASGNAEQGCSASDLKQAASTLACRNAPHPHLLKLLKLALRQVSQLVEVRRGLLEAESLLRQCEDGLGCHTAAADLVHLAATTVVWFTAERQYVGFTSPPLSLANNNEEVEVADSKETTPAPGDAGGTAAGKAQQLTRKKSEQTLPGRRYSPWFLWGQLCAWHKQAVQDPTSSLNNDRRGPLILPDIESCYHTRSLRYTAKERAALLDHIEKKPDVPWKVGGLFTFKKENRVFGSPMFDGVYLPQVLETESNLAGVVAHLRGVSASLSTSGGGAASASAAAAAAAAGLVTRATRKHND